MAPMQAPWQDKNKHQVAFIREDECIGCTKCLPDCPTDAILGGSKLMHTVITDVCTGCELCVAPCPVDCIEMRPVEKRDPETEVALEALWDTRFAKHNARIERDKRERTAEFKQAKLDNALDSVEARKRYIEAVLKRKNP